MLIKSWNAVKHTVPDKVRQALNMGELNIQWQLDKPFLITSGKGEISRAVNKVIDIEEATIWLSTLTSQKQKNSMAITRLEKSIPTQQASIKQVAEPLAQVEDLLVAAEQLNRRLVNKRKRAQGIRSAVDGYRRAYVRLDALKPAYKAEKLLFQAEALATVIRTLEKKLTAIHNFIRVVAYLIELNEQVAQVRGDYMHLMNKLGKCPWCLSIVNAETMKRLTKEL